MQDFEQKSALKKSRFSTFYTVKTIYIAFSVLFQEK